MKDITKTLSSGPTYKAAGKVATIIERHFRHFHAKALADNNEIDLAPTPSCTTIESLIDISFWASLRREEGFSPKFTLAFLPPEAAGQPLLFGGKIKLAPNILTKFASAVQQPGIHLGIWIEDDELYIWGTTLAIPAYCFVLEVIEPGLLVIKHRRIEGFGKFVNIAILKGDDIKVVDEHGSSISDCPNVLSAMLDFTLPSLWNDPVNVLVQLATSMQAHKRGGILLVVPSGSEEWRESIITPISYPVDPPFSGLTDLMIHEGIDRYHTSWQEKMRRAVDTIGGLTSIDGATLIYDKHELLAFGAKIGRSEKSSPIEEIVVTEPIVGCSTRVIHPAQNGGTRHLAAAQFVYD
ncbi:putative sensor domain DACNV-containing protein, partial [Mucilaginibacter sp.]|uniref:putative sensor domain DACNV-containing protein n=1 Tax=Mucilaginibacter sp. TaxID=1882438 RepID=UPI002ED33A08